MKLSSELYHAGILRRQETRRPTDFTLESRPSPRYGQPEYSMGGFQRREQSTKVNARGWRLLSNVLRLH